MMSDITVVIVLAGDRMSWICERQYYMVTVVGTKMILNRLPKSRKKVSRSSEGGILPLQPFTTRRLGPTPSIVPCRVNLPPLPPLSLALEEQMLVSATSPRRTVPE